MAASRRRRRAKRTGSGGDPDAVRLYLRDIGSVDLLSAEEEVELALRVQDGLRAQKQLAELDAPDSCPIVSAEQRRAIRQAAADGQIAFDHLTSANLRLVVSIAKRYTRQGTDLLDLVQDGNFGLMRAVEKFDPTRGFKFSTYATWWIRQAISRSAAEQPRTIRLPGHLVDQVNRIGRVERELVQELGREPTLAEVAAVMDLPIGRLRELRDMAREPVSLDASRNDEDETTLSDRISDDDAMAPADVAATKMLVAEVRKVLGELNEREREVVRMRFGLEDGPPKTLEEVGRTLGVTRERIRQIEAKTLAKLRHPDRSRSLRDFLDADG